MPTGKNEINIGLPISSMNVQTITSSGTYTPSSNFVAFAIVEVIGGGASGRAATGTTGTIGGGGGAGGYAKGIVYAGQLYPNVSVTIGSGGTANSTTGTAGGTTTFGNIISATGGGLGTTYTNTAAIGIAPGGSPGVGSGGNIINLNGGSGETGYFVTTTNCAGGYGGGGLYGRGGGDPLNLNATANTGGGGAGAVSTGNGGNGAAGIVIVTEFRGSAGTVGQVNVINNLSTSSAFTGIGTRAFTSSGTYNPTAGMKFCIVDVQGAGAAGGNAQTTVSNSLAVGGGGGSGAFSRSFYTAAQIGGSQSVTIGAIGANTSFGSLIVCGSGAAGANGNNQGDNPVSIGGNRGNVVTSGNIFALPGIRGGLGLGRRNQNWVGGNGGGGYLNMGAAIGALSSSSNGNAAIANTGAGGGGATMINSVGSRTGGAGSTGIVTILEFY